MFPCIVASLIGAELLIAATLAEWNWRPFAAFLFRYDAETAVGVAQFTWLLWFDSTSGRKTRSPRLIRSGLFAAGAATIAGPVLLAGGMAGLSADFLARHRRILNDLLPLAPRATLFRTGRATEAPDGARGLLSRSGGADRGRIVPRDAAPAWPPDAYAARHRAIATLMALMTVIFYYKGLVRVLPLHFVFSVIPATILMAICAGRLWRRGRTPHLFALLICFSLLVPTLYGSIALVRGAGFRQIVGGRLIADARGGNAGDDAVIACVERPATHLAWVPDSYAVVAGYVRRHSREGEPIFVGLKRHDRIFINDVALYFVAGRLPGTHWAIFDAGLQTQQRIQTAMIADLTRSQVAWIIRNGDYESVHEPNESNRRDGAPLLDRWIAAHYRQVVTAGPLDVLLRNDRPVPADDAAPVRCRLDPVRATAA